MFQRFTRALLRVALATLAAFALVLPVAVTAHGVGTLSISGTAYLELGPTRAPDVRVEWTRVGQAHDPANFVTTDANGDYTITGLDDGSYYLFFDYSGAGGYLDQWFASITPKTPWAVDPVDGADPINLGGSSATQINVGLERPGSIAGVISLGNTSVHPAEGEVLVSYRCLTKKATSFGAWSTPVPSGAGGSYLFENVPPSPNCQLFFDYQGAGTYLDRYWDADTAYFASSFPVYGRLSVTKNITIPDYVPVTGHVSLGSAAVAAGAGDVVVTATLSGSSTPIAGVTATTDGSGNYQLFGAPTAALNLVFTYVGSGGFVGVTTVPLVSGARTKDVTLAAGYSISGHVYLDTAATSATVGLVRVLARNAFGTEVGSATTDAAGNYRVSGLYQHTYYLTFQYLGAEDYPDWYYSPSGGSMYPVNSAPIPLSSGVTGKNVIIGAGAAIAGTVTDSSHAPLAGHVVNAYGYAVDADPDASAIPWQTTTMADGTYRFRALPQGYDYLVDFEETPDYAYEAWDDASEYYYSDYVTIDVGDVSVHGGIDAELEHPATISGVITIAGPVPPGFNIAEDLITEVLVLDGSTNTWVETGDYFNLDSSGAYAITGLKPDNYRVAVYYADIDSFEELRSGVLNAAEGASVVYSPTIRIKPLTISELYASLGGPTGSLGAPVSGIGSYPNAGGGSLQHFANGSIYSSSIFGTHVVWAGPIRETYWAANSVLGSYGWPGGDQDCVTDTCTQWFMGGVITPEALVLYQPPFLDGGNAVGGTIAVNPGTYTPSATSHTYKWFRDGVLIPGATGPSYVPVVADMGHTLHAEVTAIRAGFVPIVTPTDPSLVIVPSAASQLASLYASLGGSGGSLGPAVSAMGTYPTIGGGSLQHFANGSIYSSNLYGAWVVWAGPIRDIYWAENSIFGPYTWPRGEQTCVSGTCIQLFNPGFITVAQLGVNVAPSVSGPALVGGTLTAAPGSYTPTATSFRYGWLRDGVRISGATAATYVPTAADAGHTLQVEVTASRAGSVAAVTVSAATGVIAPSAAMQLASLYASLGGSGGSLGAATSSLGAYPNNGGGSLQHFANGSIYSSNTSGAWVVWAGPIRDAYWASNSIFGTYQWPSGAQSCVSGTCTQQFIGGTLSAAPLVVSVAPAISGAPQVGAPLVVSAGTYSPSATSVKYAWLRGGVRIAGATAATYVPTAADAGQTLQVEVTASRVGSVSVVTLSAATAAIGPSAASQIASLYASLGGSAGSLGAASSAVGAYPNNGGGSLQHFANGSIYSSNSSGTWVVWAGPIRDAYWASNSIFGAYQWPSGAQSCVSGTCTQQFIGGTLSAAPLVVSVAPAISGATQVGAPLVVSAGTYSPAATSVKYAWLRDGARISGATAATYVPTAADAGHTLQAEVTASRTGSVSTVTLTAATVAIGPSAASQIASLYASLGGSGGSLGAAVSALGAYPNNGGGSLQHFANGSIYSSHLSGTWVVWAGPIRDAYWASNSIFGSYQWPSGAQSCVSGTCTQQFIGGTLSAAPLLVSVVPTISGPALVGGTLTAAPGSYTPAATSLKYAWLRDGVRVAGATAATFVLTAADLGRTLQVEVTASRTGSVSTVTLSAASAVVAPSAASQIASLYASLGGSGGSLGAAVSPLDSFSNNGGGSLRHFANGSIYSSHLSGTWVVWAGPIRNTYWAASSIFGIYRWPSGEQSCASGTCTQQFAGGTISGGATS